jgi:hypothetical protein
LSGICPQLFFILRFHEGLKKKTVKGGRPDRPLRIIRAKADYKGDGDFFKDFSALF